ncbi:MAG: glycoside hydrolase family 127 protein, partial [Verrucomicrobia bacterium]|nr:glycoside hydrolase family 127 protein [Verrucomicrobiota bacterium]
MKIGLSRFIIYAAAGCLAAQGGAVNLPAHRPAGVLQRFSYADVSLSGGPLGAQARFARRFYLAIPDDNLLNGFRLRAGMPAPGRPMGGWYDPNNFAGGCAFGQYLSSLARDYANTGDTRFKEKVARLVHGFHETIAPDGFFFMSVKISTNWPCYTYDKNCTGMRDAYALTGDKEALVVLKTMTDWAFKHLPRRKDEWYTLPENLYDCYALTRDKRYLEMAREYDYRAQYYDVFANGTNAFTPDRHAYSHVNSLCSAAKAYEVTGDEKYFRAISNAWEFLTGTQMYASGGWGPNERFVPVGQGKLAASLVFDQTRWHFRTRSGDYANNFETPCGTYANANLDRYLLHFTGDAKYGDNLERVLFNGILAALPMRPDGRTFYYSDYHPGAHKQYFPSRWPCCSGTYAEVTADYPLDIYFHDDGGLYVNLFTPSRVRWQHGGKIVTLEQTTEFPMSDTTAFVLHLKRAAHYALHVRVPEWAAKPATVLLNHRPVDVAA